MIREVVKCAHCSLIQFVTVDATCRRCHQLVNGLLPAPSALGATTGALPAAASQSIDAAALPRYFPFGLVVQLGRSARGMSRQQLAQRAGLSFQQVYRIERHGHYPHYHTVRSVARALGVRPSFLARMTDVVAQINRKEGPASMRIPTV